MKCDMFNEKIKYIMPGGDLWRVYARDCEDHMEVQFDPHGMTRAAAKRHMKNIIALVPNAFILDVIHGYNGGTRIRDMIREETLSHRICNKHYEGNNPGRTIIDVLPRCA